MWYVKLEGNNYNYEINELLKLFIEPNEINFIENRALAENQGFFLVCSIKQENHIYNISSTLFNNEKLLVDKKLEFSILDNDKIATRKILKRKLKICTYEVLSQYFKINLPWGILTGIRPTKIVHELMEQKVDNDSIRSILQNEYKIQEDKINLMLDIAKIERPYLVNNNKTQVSIYISIPFCPSKCLYCSFPSNPLNNKDRSIVSQYIKALLYEIELVFEQLKSKNKTIDSLYIGGGTPTTLTAQELELLLSYINNKFPLNSIREITVEAGRPDTITKEKLSVLKNNGIERISINPQTMNLKTLKEIGRNHSPKDIENSLKIARDIGFKTINMDLIVGLPLETPLMVENTMKIIENYSPENLTVHTLAIKRSSKLNSQKGIYNLPTETEVKEMLEITDAFRRNMGLIPYYMYRQKYMVGNFENIGYCLPKHECIYNIQMMEEKQTVIGLGAGSSSKFYFPEENRIQRIANVTNVHDYINRIDEMIQRKVEFINS